MTTSKLLALMALAASAAAEVCMNSGQGLFSLPPVSPNCKTLDLSFNSLYYVPATEMGALHNITDLSLANNMFSYLENGNFISMYSLTRLDMSNNALPNIGADMLAQGALRTLSFEGNSLTNIDNWAFRSLWNLQDLNLAGNSLSGMLPEALDGGLASLTRLDLSSNPLEYLHFGMLDSMSNLQTLNLANTPGETGCEPTLPSECSVTQTTWPLNHTFCYCPTSAFSGDGGCIRSAEGLLSFPSSFGSMCSLIDLSSNMLSYIDTVVLSGLTGVLSLDLSNNWLSGQLQTFQFAGLWSLRDLNLAGNKLETIGPDDLNGALTQLNLNDNMISAFAPGAFRSFAPLQELWMKNNRLISLPTDFLPYSPSSLTILDVSDNPLFFMRSGALASAINLSYLNVAGTPGSQGCAGELSMHCSFEQVAPATDQAFCVCSSDFDFSPDMVDQGGDVECGERAPGLISEWSSMYGKRCLFERHCGVPDSMYLKYSDTMDCDSRRTWLPEGAPFEYQTEAYWVTCDEASAGVILDPEKCAEL